MSFKYPVVMPKMSMTMETGELIIFHVKVGDHVKSGDVLFEVMTDKIDMEVDAPADGVIDSLLAEPGAVIEIGKPVLIMLTDTEVMAFDFGSEEVEAVQVEQVEKVEVKIAPPVAAVILNESVKAVPKLAPRRLSVELIYAQSLQLDLIKQSRCMISTMPRLTQQWLHVKKQIEL